MLHTSLRGRPLKIPTRASPMGEREAEKEALRALAAANEAFIAALKKYERPPRMILPPRGG
jgi:hypothetical protein